MPSSPHLLVRIVVPAALAIGGLLAPEAIAQDTRVAKKDPTDPVTVELTTADGVLLSGTYYRADKAGKDTPIVVMLADEGDSPAVFDRLALSFQFAVQDESQTTMSVLAIGLRGQGDSTRVRGPDGEVTDRRGAKLTPADATAMAKLDMEAVRGFLVDKNDAGELNLNRLAYLGVGLGALIATNAAALDWDVDILPRGKQGRDVKALVLVSPPWRQLGLDMLSPLRHPSLQSEIGLLFTYGGQDKKTKSNVERLLRQLPKADQKQDEEERLQETEAEDAPPAGPPRVIDAPGRSKLQGSDWLKQAGRGGERMILGFLEEHLVKPNHPWIRRRLE